jgi:hypothetical protein
MKLTPPNCRKSLFKLHAKIEIPFLGEKSLGFFSIFVIYKVSLARTRDEEGDQI